MKVGDRVEYQTGIASFGVGEVTSYDPETENVNVIDMDDGSAWSGPADRATRVSEH